MKKLPYIFLLAILAGCSSISNTVQKVCGGTVVQPIEKTLDGCVGMKSGSPYDDGKPFVVTVVRLPF